MLSWAMSLHPELVQCCSQVQGEKKKKITQTKVKKKYFQLQVEQIVELLFFCLRQKTKRSIHVVFFAEMVKVRERVKGKSEKSSLCCLQAVQTQV